MLGLYKPVPASALMQHVSFCNRKNFSCPSSDDTHNLDRLWNFNVTATSLNGTVLFNGANGSGTYADTSGNTYDSWPLPDETGFAVLGYVFLIKRLDGNLGPSATYPNGLPASPDNRNKHFDYQARIKPHNTFCRAGPGRQVRQSPTSSISN